MKQENPEMRVDCKVANRRMRGKQVVVVDDSVSMKSGHMLATVSWGWKGPTGDARAIAWEATAA